MQQRDSRLEPDVVIGMESYCATDWATERRARAFSQIKLWLAITPAAPRERLESVQRRALIKG